jgi:hypothetical protein
MKVAHPVAEIGFAGKVGCKRKVHRSTLRNLRGEAEKGRGERRFRRKSVKALHQGAAARLRHLRRQSQRPEHGFGILPGQGPKGCLSQGKRYEYAPRQCPVGHAGRRIDHRIGCSQCYGGRGDFAHAVRRGVRVKACGDRFEPLGDPRFEQAARGMGRSGLDTLLRVTLPLAAPGVLTGAALVVLTAIKELPATLLLRPNGFDTPATIIWQKTNVAEYASAAVPALILIAISVAPVYVLLIRPEARSYRRSS